ncbi:hypothetical protein MVES1_001976 [Malassezia vespertilionis]|nr:uncharacterized protein MVES1_001976 [Malassezia vespertilionis]WFD06622.1 hypothetical protein MVES1_001976 [Malassezia vespertilionis]
MFYRAHEQIWRSTLDAVEDTSAEPEAQAKQPVRGNGGEAAMARIYAQFLSPAETHDAVYESVAALYHDETQCREMEQKKTQPFVHGQKRSFASFYLFPDASRRPHAFRRSFSSSARTSATHATPYELLGLERSASIAEIKSSYYGMVKQLHPDVNKPTTKREGEERLEKFRAVVKAYELLRDKRTKGMYDKYGVGWEYGVVSPGLGGERFTWAQRGYNRPQSPEEWDNWHMWSEVLRRAAKDHPARNGWQHTAQRGYSSNQFYGFPPDMDPEEANRRAEQAVPGNRQFFAVIFVIVWVIAAVQIERLTSLGLQQAETNSRTTLEISRNLQDARKNARTTEGQLRQRALMERIRKSKLEHDTMPHASASMGQEVVKAPESSGFS